MRILTVVTVTLLPGSVLTGIMGMNVRARAYSLGEAGFWGVIALIFALGLTTVLIAHRRRWI